MKYKKNLFISFEGPEASGKSSQIKLLSSYFKKNKIAHIITREPGGTVIGEKLRKIILSNKENISTIEELLLLMASRINHVNKIIKPALKKGNIVISDRFADSTFVYQGFVNNFGLLKSINLHKKLLNNFLPTKTFLLLIPPKIINKRLRNRKIANKYDKIDINFHKQVIKGYNILSKNNKRFDLLDGTNSIDEIHNQIIKNLK